MRRLKYDECLEINRRFSFNFAEVPISAFDSLFKMAWTYTDVDFYTKCEEYEFSLAYLVKDKAFFYELSKNQLRKIERLGWVVMEIDDAIYFTLERIFKYTADYERSGISEVVAIRQVELLKALGKKIVLDRL
ncbi:hypothetical protein [Campylobacter sp. 19-13652]|uniref:hypothetical protein n=1 Tax=Campylobacter sp. 19-13652 TaxID=2840180 RepID=UPI001C78B784|nr:hypothetical protein [Campylobacter sp. 19-13652]BCX79271.1 hypothetical protein LBC_07330 [Campylobacter sp. 19-13652]